MNGKEKYVRENSHQFAADEAMRAGGDDPRLVAQGAEMAYRRSLEGHLEAVANPTRVEIVMKEKVPYSV